MNTAASPLPQALLAVVALLSLAACQRQESPLQKDEARYQYLQQHAVFSSPQEMCTVAIQGKNDAVDANADTETFIRWDARKMRNCELNSM